MTWFNAQVQLDLPAARLDDDDITDGLLAELAEWHASLSELDGLSTVRLSLQADTLAKATRLAVVLVETATQAIDVAAAAVAVTVMTEQEFNTRQGWPQTPATAEPTAAVAPSMLPLAEAARLLGVTRQAVSRRLLLPTSNPNHLPGTRDGGGRWYLRAIVVQREVSRRGQADLRPAAS